MAGKGGGGRSVCTVRSILNETDPTTTRILDARLRDMQGKPSESAQWQNAFADRVLAPMIGPNSASKIVAATNTGLAVWHLGMGMKLT